MSSERLKIADRLSLPLDAVTQTFAYMGKKGSGKTYAATSTAEKMIDQHAQVVAVDPVGVWFGLRLAADGKSPGISIPVFGGLHGDIPLEPTGGKIIADLIVDRGISAVIDVSQFEYDTDKARFAGDFAARLFFRKKSSPSAIHVFLEECQEFVPQQPNKGEEHMLHAFNRMVRLGRNFGIGVSLVSQRPQDVNKKALNQAECVCAFQLVGTHERKAVRDWISEKDMDEDLVDELPKLKTGNAYIWSPSWLDISEKILFARKRTFDASATPEVGKRAARRDLAPIELEQLRADMAATIERVEAEDPRALKKKVAQLEKEVATLKAQPRERVETPAFTDAERKLLSRSVTALEGCAKNTTDAAGIVQGVLQNLDERLQVTRRMSARHAVEEKSRAEKRRDSLAARGDPNGVTEPGAPTDAYQKAIIGALARFYALGNHMVSKRHAAALAGKSPRSSAFNAALASLRAAQLVQYDNSGDVGITGRGLTFAENIDTPVTSQELIEAYKRHVLNDYECTLLDAMLSSAKRMPTMSRSQLSEVSGKSMSSSAFNAALASMRQLKLIEYVGTDLKISDTLRLMR